MDENFLPFALPEFGPEEKRELIETLESGWITTGPRVERFEKEFASFIGVKHALATNSATAGLHLALEACGVGPGDEVITTPYTFTATAEVICHLGAMPVFVDIDPRTFNLDPARLPQAITTRTRALLPVHFGGQACDMAPILDLARRHDLWVVEDAAHAVPTTYRGGLVGTLGDATVFSFYATKPLTTGEGGMVTTGHDGLAQRIKVMRLHGISNDVWDRYASQRPKWYYEVVAPGYKYNMPDLAAALGIHQLKGVEAFQKKRREIAGIYNEGLEGLPLTTPVVTRPEDTHSWHLYVIQLDLEHSPVTRDEFIERLADLGIGTSVHFIPLHIMPYWSGRYGLKPGDFPVALRCYQRAVSLPIYPRMSHDDAARVVRAVKQVLRA
ncbi:MAG: DegT/DnrJ/EryC1/StrS family aminotransferase [Desulfobaccales bacterium]